MFLYHMVIEDNGDVGIGPQQVLKEGLNHRTATKWYSNGGNYFPELTELFKPASLPKWIDFKVAFGADLKPLEKPYFQFPVFSQKIIVINRDISSNLFAHFEDKLLGGRGDYVVGLPSKEDLIKQFWDSVHTLDDFLKYKPFNNPEIYIFETVPAGLIEYIE